MSLVKVPKVLETALPERQRQEGKNVELGRDIRMTAPGPWQRKLMLMLHAAESIASLNYM